MRGVAALRRDRRARRSALQAYLDGVSLLGLPLAVWAVADYLRTGSTPDPALLALLVAVLVVGELLPIHIARPGRRTDEITISTAFALALLFVAPLGVAVLAQSVPLVIDDLRRRKHWRAVLFNIAQYTLTFAAARGAYCLLTGQEFLRPEGLAHDDLLAAFVAGAVFFAVNHVTVDTAVALVSQQRVLPHLVEDLRFQLSTGGLLVCLAPLVVVASSFSLWLVPVLLLPLAAVRHSAEMASQRAHDALHDGLTGLPNRAHLHLQLQRALDEPPRRRGGPGRSTTRTWTRTRPSGSPCSPSCATGWAATSWNCTTSRSARRAVARSWASRRWCAGATPPGACCGPTTSSRSPRTPA